MYSTLSHISIAINSIANIHGQLKKYLQLDVNSFAKTPHEKHNNYEKEDTVHIIQEGK